MFYSTKLIKKGIGVLLFYFILCQSFFVGIGCAEQVSPSIYRAPLLTSQEEQKKIFQREIEQRIRTLLDPVYGKDKLVVLATSAEKGAVSIAVIIDTDLPLTPEGIVSEQNRIRTIITSALCLNLAHGDAVSVSFMSFKQAKEPLLGESDLGFLFVGIGLVLACCSLTVFILSRRSQKTVIDDEELTEKNEMEELWQQLAQERSQIQTIVLSFLSTEEATNLLSLMREENALDLLFRLEKTKRIVPDLQSVLCRSFRIRPSSYAVGLGAPAVLSILNGMEKEKQRRMLNRLTLLARKRRFF